MDVSYRGFCRLATNSGSIEWIQAELVYAADSFKPAPMGEMPEHEYDPFLSTEERGEFRGGYCVAKTTGGDYLTSYMSAQKVFDVRGRSESYKTYLEKTKTTPWVTDFEEMAKKSNVRLASKMWPRTDKHKLERMALAVQLSNEAEEFEPIKTSPDLGQFTEDQKGFFDQLIENSDSLGMLIFKRSIEETVFTNLYHSFEKGTKGKYQQVVDALYLEGEKQAKEYANMLVEAVDKDDNLAVAEIKEELSEEEMELVIKDLPEPVIAFVQAVDGTERVD